MRIGCAYPATAFGGDALKWRQDGRPAGARVIPARTGSAPPSMPTASSTSRHRLREVRLGPVDGGKPELAACGYPLPASISARIAKMPAFLAEATQPTATSCRSATPTLSTASRPRLAAPRWSRCYRPGYVFGRSTWGPNGTFYSLRFGPGRQVHGHDDHMGITYYSRGRNLIVNAGHTGYEISPLPDYIRSPEAASTLVSPSGHFCPSQPRRCRRLVAASSQYYQVGDYAFGGRRHAKRLRPPGPDFMLVLDRGHGAPYQQLWHLDPADVRHHARGAIATAPAVAAPPRHGPSRRRPCTWSASRSPAPAPPGPPQSSRARPTLTRAGSPARHSSDPRTGRHHEQRRHRLRPGHHDAHPAHRHRPRHTSVRDGHRHRERLLHLPSASTNDDLRDALAS